MKDPSAPHSPSTPSLTGNIRFAIIGCGHIGLRHADFIRANPECELTALCDTRPAGELGLKELDATGRVNLPGSAGLEKITVPFFRDEDLLMEQDFDVLCIATPNGLHERHALKALGSGRHVLIEKPMALSSAACLNILREAKERDKHIFCVMQLRNTAPSVWLKELLEKKALGRIFQVTVNCFWNRDQRYYHKDGWKGTAGLDGGSLFTQFSHFIDSLLWLFGDISGIQARFANFSHGDSIDFEDTGTISFDLQKGGMGVFNFTTSVPQRNLESSLTVIAEKGAIRIGGQYMEQVLGCTVEGLDAPQPLPFAGPQDAGPRDPPPNHAHIYDNIVAVLKKGATPDIDADEAARVIATIEKIYSRKQPF